MTRRQLAQRGFDQGEQLPVSCRRVGRGGLAGIILVLQDVQCIHLILALRRSERGKQAEAGVAYFLAAEVVANGVLQDALEQQGEFRGRFVAVALRQLDHGFLHNIQRRLLVAHRVGRMFVGAALHAGEKVGKLNGSGHRVQ